ncbi:MAG TPA: chemotaxis response regulator protein-glutamate methylesterase [Desulfobacterales bacterium]|nr:chemotaxis response regulator protein-glutamate methylesterase [Desulfobacterales bacterium]
MLSKPKPKIRVLIVDDSSLVRHILSDGINADPDLEVVGTAPEPFTARDKIVRLKPDVMTLDVDMPRMDGVEFLRRLMPQYPIPVVMVSSLTQRGKKITLDALDAGAVDFVSKPGMDISRGLQGMMTELCTKIKIASSANVSHWKNKKLILPSQRRLQDNGSLTKSADRIIAIGASTGGTEAVRIVLSGLPATTPGIVVVQHMPSDFTQMFAERLNACCAMRVKEARSGDRITSGLALIAPGEQQMTINYTDGTYKVICKPGEKICGHCPSVEGMMNSVARQAGARAIGIMLTGMGHDGADAMLAMRKAGGRTMAQDEKSSVVFGMPKEAYERGGAERLVPLDNIAGEIIKLLSTS